MRVTYLKKIIEIDTSKFEYPDDVYQKAYYLTHQYFHDNFESFMGVKVDGNFMYVKGGNNGFPHTRSHVKIDLLSNLIVSYYGADDCPVKVGEEFSGMVFD